MKSRCGFVTNSSSSSFILAFKNENTIKEQLEKENLEKYYLDKILYDAKAHQISKEDIPEYLENTIKITTKWEVKHFLEDIFGFKKSRKWIENNEDIFTKIISDKINMEIEELENELDDSDYISVVNYSDNTDSKLEHQIAPNLSVCKYIISHH